MTTDSEGRANRANEKSGGVSDESVVDELARQLRSRWDSGHATTLEEMLSHNGGLAAVDAEQLLDLIYHEILIREDHGVRVGEAEYVARFPELAPRVRRIFEIHRAVESTDLEELVAGQDSRRHSGNGDDSSAGSDGRQSSRLPHHPKIPDYEFLGEIGFGGMAVVYKARQQPLGRIVAVKVLSAGKLASPEVVRRLRQEAQAIASLQHPNILQIHEVGEYDGQPYLTLEYVAGGTLHAYLQQRPLAPLVAAELAEVLARTMEYAHAMGVVHRDLKPANVLLQTADGSESRGASGARPTGEEPRDTRASTEQGLPFRPKIADFGLAKLVDLNSDLTMTGHIVGTPSYMAPEQTDGAHDVGPAADIYSVGAILYELLTGHPPFQGVSSLEILEQVRNREPVSPRRLQPRVPRDLETICLKCLEKAPVRRYASAADLADDLRRVRQHEPILARPARVWEQGWKWTRRRPAVAILLALLASVTLAGLSEIGWLFQQMRQNALDAQGQRDHARGLHALAVQERNEAERRQREAEQAESRALESRRRAESNFDRAFQLVNEMSTLADKMRVTPYQDVAGWTLLEKSLVFYEGFLEERGGDPQVRQAAIVALLRAGEIRTAFAQHERSLEASRRAIRLLGPPPAPEAKNVDYFKNLGQAQATAAINYRGLRRTQEAEAAFHAAIEARAVAAHLVPSDVDMQRSRANTILGLCSLLRSTDRYDEAITRYSEAIDLLREVLLTQPSAFHCQFEYALALDDFGDFLWDVGQLAEGESLMRQALEIREALVRRDPKSVEFAAFLARSHHRLARCHVDRKQWQEARELAERSVTALRGAVEKFPRQMTYQTELRDVLFTLAETHRLAGDVASYRAAFHDLTRTSVTISGLFPADEESVRIAVHYGSTLSKLYAERGMHDSARNEYEHLLGNLALSLRRFPNSARINNLLAWKLVTCPFESLRNSAQACELAERAVRAAPENDSYWNTLGAAYEDADLIARALECYRRAIVLDSRGDWRHQAYLARALARFGRVDEARQVLLKIGDRSSGDDETAPVLEQARQAVQAYDAVRPAPTDVVD